MPGHKNFEELRQGMKPFTTYKFRINVGGAVGGEPRPVALAGRMEKVIHDALQADGFVVEQNALPYGIYVECVEMTYRDPEEER